MGFIEEARTAQVAARRSRLMRLDGRLRIGREPVNAMRQQLLLVAYSVPSA